MLKSEITLTRHALADLMYPVGSYYITESDELNTVAKMNAFFGGTWEQVTGRFLYGSSTAKIEGGSNDAKVISHSHSFSGNAASGSFNLRGAADGASYPDRNSTASGVFSKGTTGTSHYILNGTSNKYNTGLEGINFNMTPSGTISTVGESATGANMPAYRTVFMYRRKTLAGGGIAN